MTPHELAEAVADLYDRHAPGLGLPPRRDGPWRHEEASPGQVRALGFAMKSPALDDDERRLVRLVVADPTKGTAQDVIAVTKAHADAAKQARTAHQSPGWGAPTPAPSTPPTPPRPAPSPPMGRRPPEGPQDVRLALLRVVLDADAATLTRLQRAAWG